ncbi:MFS transporter [Arthrobacter sp. JSM 101049]|uniref:MFS transporter n=1 Tax=Arthrobacter sp. JSM 101049 TaxID=929097 RepID=UPI003565847C
MDTPTPVPPGAASETTTSTTQRGSFRSLLELAGPAFFPLAFFARLPLAMLTIGTLTLVSTATGSYASGGIAAGAVGIGSAIGAPLIGYAADRLGQRAVLIPIALVHAVVVAALIVTGAGIMASPAVVVAIMAFTAGATCPQVGPLARVRWMSLTTNRPRGRRELETALSYESTVDELTFVMGPALVGVLASLVAPWLPLALAAVVTAALVPAFAVHRTGQAIRLDRPTGGPASGTGWARGRIIRVGLCVLGMIGMGTIFGSVSAGAVSFAGAFGQASAGGLLYAALGLTSAVAALSVSVWPKGWAQPLRWAGCALVLVPLALLLQVPQSIGTMVVFLLLVGVPIGPIMVTIFTVGGDVAPLGRMGTVMTMLASGIVVGTAIGNGLAGVMAEVVGPQGAFQVAAAAAVVLFLAGAGMFALGRVRRTTSG